MCLSQYILWHTYTYVCNHTHLTRYRQQWPLAMGVKGLTQLFPQEECKHTCIGQEVSTCRYHCLQPEVNKGRTIKVNNLQISSVYGFKDNTLVPPELHSPTTILGTLCMTRICSHTTHNVHSSTHKYVDNSR